MLKSLLVNKRYDLSTKDGRKALIIAILTPVIYFLQELIPGWDVDPIIKTTISAVIAYVIKNFFSPPSVVTTYETNAQAEAVEQSILEKSK